MADKSIFRSGWELQKQGYIDDAIKVYETDTGAGKFHLNCMYRGGQWIEIDHTRSCDWDEIILGEKEINEIHDCYKEREDDKYIQNNIGLLYKHYKKNYKKAVKWYKFGADQGYRISQFNLGEMYFWGYGVDKDYKVAHGWYMLAANQDYDGAQYKLGLMYENGYGMEQDYKLAHKWYMLAATKDHNIAQYKLGLMYEKGYGIEQDYKEALKWYLLAKDNDNAQLHIGNMYYFGRGVEQNHYEAFKWIKSAAEQNNKIAQYNTGSLYYNGKGIERNDNEAFRWYKLSAKQNYDCAQYMIGYLYFNGHGTEKNYKKALKFFLLVHDNDNAQYQIGNIYHYGYGIERDDKEAFKWYKLSADQNNYRSQYMMGLFYENGYTVEKNFEEAQKWYTLSAESGYFGSQTQMALLHFELKICEELGHNYNYIEGYKWIEKAAQSGNIDALYNAGSFYAQSYAPNQNYAKALEYWTQASNKGHHEAHQRLEFFRTLKSRIENNLLDYIQLRRDEGISYLFFCNFLAYLTEHINKVNLNDGVVKPLIKEVLISYFISLNPQFKSEIIDEWYDEFY